MASSYGNDLRIEEQAVGENSGTWGTKVNASFSQIADGFSYGTKAMSADANETFTMPDGTADATRSLYLKITSSATLTATRTVTLGPNSVSKLWLVENATTGSQSIIIKQGSGATVTIASGGVRLIYTDGAGSGAAVVDAFTDLATSGTFTTAGAATFNGAITGTTATFSTADNLTQVRLISTDNDSNQGPRLDFFRNSASPAAGDFIGRMRFLGEDAGGNETAYVHFDTIIDDPTDGSEDGQLRIETKLDGTMVERIGLDSTDTVFNEDSKDFDFRIESDSATHAFFLQGSSGRVAINTSNPSSIFHAAATNSTVWPFTSAQSGTYSYTPYPHEIVIDNEVAGTEGSFASIFFTAGADSDGSKISAARIGAIDTGNYSADIVFGTRNTSFQERMRIAADGSVGINKSVPGRTLDVDGNFRVTHSENDGFNITANDTVGNSAFSGMLLSYTASGSDTLSGDRNHIGLDIDVDSSASGGNTSEEHRLFGVQSSVKATGDSDIIYGLYANAEAEISTGQVSSMYGVYGRVESDGAGGQISNTYGVLGTAILNNDASVTQTSAHGIFGKTTVSASNAADINNLMGGYFEVQLDEPAAANIPINYIYGNRIEVDINDDGSGNGYDLSSTNSYLLYANYSVVSGGSMPGNAYGLYINDTVQNFIRGSLRVDDGAVFNDQGLAASDFRVEGDTNSNLLFVNAGDDQVIIGAAASLSPSDYGLYARNGLVVGNYSGAGAGLAVYRGVNAQTQLTHSSTNGFLSTGGVPLHFRTALTGTAYRLSMQTDELVVNEGSQAAYDFRVESNTQTHMLFVDSDNNFVGFNASTATANSGGSFSAYTGGITLNVSHNGSAANGDAYVSFRRTGTTIGSITQVSSTGGAYNTSSDARLKENIIDADAAGQLLDQIKVRQFDWRENGEHQRYGMIAQELAEVIPEVVSVPSDPDDMQGIDYSKLMPLVIKEIQDLRARVEQLTRS